MVVYASNRKAHFNYELRDRFEAGLALKGHEVKAIKAGKLTLLGARVIIRGGEVYLIGAGLEPYQPHNLPPNLEPGRPLRLLLTKKEIKALAASGHGRGLTIIPVSVYNKGGRLKLELAVARGKKQYDKREAIKRRDVKRQMDRTLKNS